MQRSDGWLSGPSGLDLYYQRWLPEGQTKAVVGMVHGLGSHSDWFMNLVRPLVAHGYGVYALDLRGHGQSPGQRGFIHTWTDFREDFHQFWQLIQAQHGDCPGFALGHSLGAVVVLDYVLDRPETTSGIIALAPAIGAVGVSPMKLALGHILSKVWPRFTLETGLKDRAGSRDPIIMSAYDADPLRHSKGTARLATEFLKTQCRIQSQLSKLAEPILILHGSHDSIALPESARTAFEQLRHWDKEYREYPGAYHDLHNDICVSTVVEDMLCWLKNHAQPGNRLCCIRQPRIDGSAPART